MSDPFYNNVGLHLRYVSGTLTDVSDTAAALTNNGTTEDTTNVEFLASTIDFSGSSQYIQITGYDISTEDAAWTMRCRIRFDTFPTSSHFLSTRPGVGGSGLQNRGVSFSVTSAGELGVQGWTSGGSYTQYDSSGAGLVTGQFYDLEVGFDGTNIYMFVDGALVGTHAHTASFFDDTGDLNIGVVASGVNAYMDGQIEEIQWTQGICRNTSSFTAHTAAFPTSQGFSARVSIPSPLAPPEIVSTALNPHQSRVSIPSPLAAPEFVVTNSIAGPEAIISIPSPLASPAVVFTNDITAFITEDLNQYVMRVTGATVLEIPISSWQATRQTDRQDYLQCVIPAVGSYVGELATRQGSEEFVVYRLGKIGSSQIETEMARAPLTTILRNSGAFNDTATLSGYADNAGASASGTRTVTGIRQKTNTQGGNSRIRCDIDWILQPGQVVDAGDVTLTANYINYFVPARGDAYMDVGSRG